MCRDAFRTKDDDFSDDDETLGSELDEDTYATYDESIEPRRGKDRKNHDDYDDEAEKERRHSSQRKEKEKKDKADAKKAYEDDGTLETEDSADRVREKGNHQSAAVSPQPPLGLAPTPPPEPVVVAAAAATDEETNPNAPIRELEYDDRVDHGADVSVMESLGGPSLLIEKQRAAQANALRAQIVPDDIIKTFGLDYPATFGMTREETIQSNPLKYYTYVVKKLLEDHEPEESSTTG